ncbi:MAG: ABC transporter ATP-binding protein [Oscillospiraceae bacterium]|jgi:putative ABC transport system ATP-binding protein|nr:ABC transporter ATP-binding protein [Oscillospiraceae bacterium]
MLLEVSGITKKYSRGNTEFNAVDNASFAVSGGDFTVINGQSGSGKSTLLAIAAGLLNPDSGTVVFDGEDLGKLGDTQLSALRNEKIGFIPQGHCLLDNFTVFDNVCLPFKLLKRSGDPGELAAKLLEQVGVTQLSKQFPPELSGGEIRRAAIARGLINSPKLLIADEPTGDLDPDNAANIMRLFREIAESGTAVLVVTHEREKPAGTSSRLIMNNGVLFPEAA